MNAIDENRNSPLHIIVAYQKPISDFLTLHAITTALIESGAHIDSVNIKNKTPLDSATTGVAEILLKSQMKINLKCLSARAVKKYGIDYRGNVPQSMVEFIDLHGFSHKHWPKSSVF